MFEIRVLKNDGSTEFFTCNVTVCKHALLLVMNV